MFSKSTMGYLVLVLLLVLDQINSLKVLKRRRKKVMSLPKIANMRIPTTPPGVTTPSQAIDSFTDRTSTSEKDPRLFTNIFGLLGHPECSATVNGRSVTGLCYNEVECFVNGGTKAGYCGPNPISGACCVFVAKDCDQTIRRSVAYFTNPSFPEPDSQPMSCQLKINILPNVCWVRFDYEILDIHITAGSMCLRDSMTILNSPDGQSGQFCGKKQDFSHLVRPNKEGQLTLAVMLQSPSHKWHIKITQVKCGQIKGLKEIAPVNCGSSNSGTGVIAPDVYYDYDYGVAPQDPDQPFEFDGLPKTKTIGASVIGTKSQLSSNPPKFRTRRRKKKKKRRRPKNLREQACDVEDPQEALCQYFVDAEIEKQARASSAFRRRTKRMSERRKTRNILMKRKLHKQIYQPTFSMGRRRGSEFEGFESEKIVDGFVAGLHAYPWAVSLQFLGFHVCGGSLITQDLVITAAHCFDFGTIDNFLDLFSVVVGEHDLSLQNETDVTQRLKVTKVIMNPRYGPPAGNPGDIAMLKLERKVDFGPKIGPVCLPEMRSESFAGMTGTAAGWGVTETGNPSDLLREAQLFIISNMSCVETTASAGFEIDGDMLCVNRGPNGTESVCNGDSGGPLTVTSGFTGRHILVGLTSYGLTDCLTPFPAVFTRVTYYLDWIAAVISLY